jgi:hypothetical protein
MVFCCISGYCLRRTGDIHSLMWSIEVNKKQLGARRYKAALVESHSGSIGTNSTNEMTDPPSKDVAYGKWLHQAAI